MDAQEILDNELMPVFRETDDSWRHGADVCEVYKRESDGSFWLAQYRLSTDREYNGLREGNVDIQQCWPEIVSKTIYTTERPGKREE